MRQVRWWPGQPGLTTLVLLRSTNITTSHLDNNNNNHAGSQPQQSLESQQSHTAGQDNPWKYDVMLFEVKGMEYRVCSYLVTLV